MTDMTAEPRKVSFKTRIIDLAKGPHAVWQLDASERIPLATGDRVSWLRGVDEFTGAVLGTRVFTPRVLESGAGVRNSTVFAPAISSVGAAPGPAGGQRRTLGQSQ